MNINRGLKIIHPNGEEKVRFPPNEPRRLKFHIYNVRWSLFNI